MGIALIELTDAWSVRERYILVRDQAALASYAQSLIDTLCGHYQEPLAYCPVSTHAVSVTQFLFASDHAKLDILAAMVLVRSVGHGKSACVVGAQRCE